MGDHTSLREGVRSGTPKDPNPKPSARQLFQTILQAIKSATENTFLVYDQVDAANGSRVVDSLDADADVERIHPRINYSPLTQELTVEVMLTAIHGCYLAWLVSEMARMVAIGFVTPNDVALIPLGPDTRFENFKAPFTAARKQPNNYIMPDTQRFPTVVFESSLHQTRLQLHQAKSLWLSGGRPDVRVVFLFRWSKRTQGRIAGDVELWDLDAAGNERLLQSITLFPVPPAPTPYIDITRGQLFGNALPAPRNPNDRFRLHVGDLRARARAAITKEGYTPA